MVSTFMHYDRDYVWGGRVHGGKTRGGKVCGVGLRLGLNYCVMEGYGRKSVRLKAKIRGIGGKVCDVYVRLRLVLCAI